MKLEDVFNKIPKEQDVIFHVHTVGFDYEQGGVPVHFYKKVTDKNLYDRYKDYKVEKMEIENDNKEVLAITLTKWF